MNRPIRAAFRLAALSVAALTLVAVSLVAPASASPAMTARPQALNLLTPPIVITPLALPDATGAVSYSQQLSAAGGDGGPYTFTVRRFFSHLPPGLTLSSSGLLSGIPAQAGRFWFTVRATDQHGKVGARTYRVTVDPGMSVTAGFDGVSATYQGLLSGGTGITVQPRYFGPIRSVNGSTLLPVPTGGLANFSISIGSVPSVGGPVYLGTVSVAAPDGTLVVALTNEAGSVTRTGAASMSGHFVGSGVVKGQASATVTLDVRVVAPN